MYYNGSEMALIFVSMSVAATILVNSIYQTKRYWSIFPESNLAVFSAIQHYFETCTLRCNKGVRA